MRAIFSYLAFAGEGVISEPKVILRWLFTCALLCIDPTAGTWMKLGFDIMFNNYLDFVVKAAGRIGGLASKNVRGHLSTTSSVLTSFTNSTRF